MAKFLFGAAAALLLATTVQAETTCMPRDMIVATLSESYEEELVGRGIQGDIRLFEVFVSASGTSWTMIQTFPNGVSCVMAAGTDWLEGGPKQLAGIPG